MSISYKALRSKILNCRKDHLTTKILVAYFATHPRLIFSDSVITSDDWLSEQGIGQFLLTLTEPKTFYQRNVAKLVLSDRQLSIEELEWGFSMEMLSLLDCHISSIIPETIAFNFINQLNASRLAGNEYEITSFLQQLLCKMIYGKNTRIDFLSSLCRSKDFSQVSEQYHIDKMPQDDPLRYYVDNVVHGCWDSFTHQCARECPSIGELRSFIYNKSNHIGLFKMLNHYCQKKPDDYIVTWYDIKQFIKEQYPGIGFVDYWFSYPVLHHYQLDKFFSGIVPIEFFYAVECAVADSLVKQISDRKNTLTFLNQYQEVTGSNANVEFLRLLLQYSLYDIASMNKLDANNAVYAFRENINAQNLVQRTFDYADSLNSMEMFKTIKLLAINKRIFFSFNMLPKHAVVKVINAVNQQTDMSYRSWSLVDRRMSGIIKQLRDEKKPDRTTMVKKLGENFLYRHNGSLRVSAKVHKLKRDFVLPRNFASVQHFKVTGGNFVDYHVAGEDHAGNYIFMLEANLYSGIFKLVRLDKYQHTLHNYRFVQDKVVIVYENEISGYFSAVSNDEKFDTYHFPGEISQVHSIEMPEFFNPLSIIIFAEDRQKNLLLSVAKYEKSKGIDYKTIYLPNYFKHIIQYDIVNLDQGGVFILANDENNKPCFASVNLGNFQLNNVAIPEAMTTAQALYQLHKPNDVSYSQCIVGINAIGQPLMAVRGSNQHGELGLGTTEQQQQFICTQLPCELVEITAVHIQYSAIYVVGKNKHGKLCLAAAGRNDFGQLGVNHKQKQNYFALINVSSQFVDIDSIECQTPYSAHNDTCYNIIRGKNKLGQTIIARCGVSNDEFYGYQFILQSNKQQTSYFINYLAPLKDIVCQVLIPDFDLKTVVALGRTCRLLRNFLLSSDVNKPYIERIYLNFPIEAAICGDSLKKNQYFALRLFLWMNEVTYQSSDLLAVSTSTMRTLFSAIAESDISQLEKCFNDESYNQRGFLTYRRHARLPTTNSWSNTERDTYILPLEHACMVANSDTVEFLLERTDTTDHFRFIYIAAKNNRIDVMELFINHYATYLQQHIEEEVSQSIQENHEQLAILLLKKNNVFRIKHVFDAINKGMIDVVEYMFEHDAISKGFDVNKSCQGGMTPLHFAVKHNRPNLAAFLLANNANYQIKDGQGLTPLDLIDTLKEDNDKQAMQTIFNIPSPFNETPSKISI